MENHFKLQTWDYITFISTVTLTAGVGIYHIFGDKNRKSTKDFLVKSDDIGIFPLILSSAATYLSAVGLLGFPMETYMFGMQCFAMSIHLLLAILPACYIFLPVLHKLKISSVFEYLEMRYNRRVRVCASMLYNFQIIMYTSCVIYAPSLALNQVTGLHLWGSVSSVGFICIVYTSLGGLKSVVWADAAQIIIMFGSLILLLIKGTMDVGGLNEVWKRVENSGRDTFVHLTSHPQSPYTIWTYIIGGTTASITETVCNQMQVQRYLSSPNLRRTKWIVSGGLLGTSIIISLTSLLGIVIYANYADCDPYLKGVVSNRNQIVPLFGVQNLSFANGLPGIFVASMFCATLSTLSSCLNSLATITIEDYILPFKLNLSEAKLMLLSKAIAILYGVLCVALVAVAESMGSLVQAVFMIFGAIGGPIFSLYFCGMLIPWVTSLGAACGCFAGLVVGFWAAIGTIIVEPPISSPPLSISNCSIFDELVFIRGSFENLTTSASEMEIPNNDKHIFLLYSMAYWWYAAATLTVGVMVAIFTSIITGVNNPSMVDSKLLCAKSQHICCIIHSKILQCLGYHIHETVMPNLQGQRCTTLVEESYIMLPLPNRNATN